MNYSVDWDGPGERDRDDGELYTEGVCEDGAAILKDGVRMTISEVLAELNATVRADWAERLRRIRLYAQDTLDNGYLHVAGPAVGNLMSIRDEVDVLITERTKGWSEITTASPTDLFAGEKALRNAAVASREIITRLIALEYNIETWGLRQRLAAIDSALGDPS